MKPEQARAFLAHAFGAGDVVHAADDAETLRAGLAHRESAHGAAGPMWADVGAGEGTFTRALAELLGAGATIYAIDKDAARMQAIEGVMARPARVVSGVADIDDGASWARLGLPALDGIVLANTLHYVPHHRQRATMERLRGVLKPGGRLVVIEYEDRAANRWVPYPVPFARLAEMVADWVDGIERRAERPSAFGGGMYLAVSTFCGEARTMAGSTIPV